MQSSPISRDFREADENIPGVRGQIGSPAGGVRCRVCIGGLGQDMIETITIAVVTVNKGVE